MKVVVLFVLYMMVAVACMIRVHLHVIISVAKVHPDVMCRKLLKLVNLS